MARREKNPHPPGCEIPMHTVDALTVVLEFINDQGDSFVAFCKGRNVNPKHVYDLQFMVREGRRTAKQQGDEQ